MPELRPDLPLAYGGSRSQTLCVAPGLYKEGVAPHGVVVHYTVEGRGNGRMGVPATPDRNLNRIPDYVECVEAAASRALDGFKLAGFRAPPADHSGPDRRIDIYLARRDIATQGWGRVVRDPRGDRYILLADSLDMRAPLKLPLQPSRGTGLRVYQGLWFTLAHELFHLVQSAYVPLEAIPPWIKEGTANSEMLTAMYERQYPRSLAEEIDTWLEYSYLPLAKPLATGGCDPRCYGGTLFWLYFQLLNLSPQRTCEAPIRCLFEYLADMHSQHRSFGDGSSAVKATVQAFGEGLDVFFASFAAAQYEAAGPGGPSILQWKPTLFVAESGSPTVLMPVQEGRSLPQVGEPSDARVNLIRSEPLSVQRVPLEVSTRTRNRTIDVYFNSQQGAVAPLLFYGGARGIRVAPADVSSDGIYHYVVDPAAAAAVCPTCRPDLVDLLAVNPNVDQRPVYRLLYFVK